jgi:hypothetical protein
MQMSYRNEDDARDLYEWECWERLAGEADDSVSERYASTADDAARFAETEVYDNGFVGPLLPGVMEIPF